MFTNHSSTPYYTHPSIVFGFHACEREIGEMLLSGEAAFRPSENDYDWLGHGMYFWEHSLTRAKEYAEELATKRHNLKEPFVVGAAIKLGYCFDLTDSHSLNLLKAEYLEMASVFNQLELTIPENEKAYSRDSDFLYRKLDCSVIQYMHSKIDASGDKPFDTVRGVFWEGDELYPTAGFKEKNHVQLCIRNPNAIKGYFRPLEFNPQFNLV